MTRSITTAPIPRALLGATLILSASAALSAASPEYVGPELAQRLLGVLLGGVVVVYANNVPKVLTPLFRMRCAPETEQALRRFTGWSLALGGVGYAAAWLLAPLGVAWLLGVGALGGSVLLVALRFARTLAGPSYG